MMRNNRTLALLTLVLVLMGQGSFAFAAQLQQGMCGMAGMSGEVSIDAAHTPAQGGDAGDCGHPMGKDAGPCIQCSLCGGGHCLGWALPVPADIPEYTPRSAEPFVTLQEQVPGDSPARIYRPPRFSV